MVVSNCFLLVVMSTINREYSAEWPKSKDYSMSENLGPCIWLKIGSHRYCVLVKPGDQSRPQVTAGLICLLCFLVFRSCSCVTKVCRRIDRRQCRESSHASQSFGGPTSGSKRTEARESKGQRCPWWQGLRFGTTNCPVEQRGWTFQGPQETRTKARIKGGRIVQKCCQKMFTV